MYSFPSNLQERSGEYLQAAKRRLRRTFPMAWIGSILQWDNDSGCLMSPVLYVRPTFQRGLVSEPTGEKADGRDSYGSVTIIFLL